MRCLNTAGHLKTCGCKFTEKWGQTNVHSIPVPFLHRNGEPPPGWQYMSTVIPKPKPLYSSEHPKLNQSTHKLSLWYFVTYLQQISGKLWIWEEDERYAALHIKYLNMFAFPLSSYTTMSFVFWQCELYLRSCQAMSVFLQRQNHVDTNGVCGCFSRGCEGDCFSSFP